MLTTAKKMNLKKLEELLLVNASPFNWGEMRNEIEIKTTISMNNVNLFCLHSSGFSVIFNVLFNDNSVEEYVEYAIGWTIQHPKGKTGMYYSENDWATERKLNIAFKVVIEGFVKDLKEAASVDNMALVLNVSGRYLPFPDNICDEVIRKEINTYGVFYNESDFMKERKKALNQMANIVRNSPLGYSITCGFEYSKGYRISYVESGEYLFTFEGNSLQK